jgi:hypothetical protein
MTDATIWLDGRAAQAATFRSYEIKTWRVLRRPGEIVWRKSNLLEE